MQLVLRIELSPEAVLDSVIHCKQHIYSVCCIYLILEVLLSNVVYCLKTLHHKLFQDLLVLVAVEQVWQIILVTLLNWLYPVSCIFRKALLVLCHTSKKSVVHEIASIYYNQKVVVIVFHVFSVF